MKKSDRRQAESDFFGNAETGPQFTLTATFVGTTNHRHLRVIETLIEGPKTREMLDRIAGCSNAPDLIFELRKRGLGKTGLPCIMVPGTDRDGFETRHGLYFFSSAGRRAVIAWLSQHCSGPNTVIVHTDSVPELQSYSVCTSPSTRRS